MQLDLCSTALVRPAHKSPALLDNPLKVPHAPVEPNPTCQVANAYPAVIKIASPVLPVFAVLVLGAITPVALLV